MDKKWRKCIYGVILSVAMLACGLTVQAKDDGTIKKGVYAEEIDLSGMTESQASAVIKDYIEGLESVEVTLVAANGQEVTVTAGELGIAWGNPELVAEAAALGTRGNVIQRYTALKDLEHENKILDIELQFDVQLINDILASRCVKYDQRAVNYSLQRENGQFKVIAGQTGYVMDVEASIDKVYNYMAEEWDGLPCRIELAIGVDEPKGSAEELAQVTDVLGSFTTSFSTSGPPRSANVINGCNLINGITLYPGEEFSTYEAVAPFSEANGYYMAGSYLNGKVVDSLGGGICQVSTTLYNAVLQAELDVSERHNHSMIVTYVDPSADAAIAESSGKDFRFVNNTDYPIYIEGYTTNDKRITFNIYGKETRDSGHTVRYESEVLEVINPPADQIYADAAQPIGYIVTASAHIGYRAKLWKIVMEDGVEVSRTEVNSSSYKMVPRSATVGVATSDAGAYEQIMAAVNSGSVDQVRAVIAALTTPPPEIYEDYGEE
ncbi:MAG: VanW family protein [Candidatus Gastranaerophilales bacterium]|nr:VanW family protein [Candidatus Gastranaerophilales bacterium]